MSVAYVDGIGVAAPGLDSWAASLGVLRGEQSYTPVPLGTFAPTLLPANEQRRATATVRIAFRVAEEAVRNSGHGAESLATVFASSDADMMVSHRICTALAQPQRLVSPTDFHNSVHNAPSGYWHIGARSHLPSSAIAAHDYSFAAGFMEAMTQVQVEWEPTLFVCYDVPAPEPLLERRPLGNAFGVALVLSPTASARSLVSVTLADLNTEAAASRAADNLEALRLSNPAARALPLLQLVAQSRGGEVVLNRTQERSLKLQIAML